MTREEIYNECVEKISKSPNILLELPTGYGKSYLAMRLINHLVETRYKGESTRMLLLVAKTVHKQTWKDEFEKWGGIKVDEVVIECYESLKKHIGETFDFCVMDECFRGDTEILTNSGYKQFKDLSTDDLVAQFTQEGNIEFVKPTRIIKRRYEGEICKLHLGRERYCYLTPNHNMVYKTPKAEEWKLKPVKELKTYHDVSIPVSGKGTGDNTPLDALDRLFIAVQADGALQRHQLHESTYSIAVKKERKKERLKWILSQLSNWSKIDNLRDYDRYLVKLPIGDAKLLQSNFNVSMGYDRANAFINEILEWDGCRIESGSTLYYSSKIKENADFVAAVAIQAGYKVLQSVEKDERKENHSPIYRLFLRKLESISTQPMTKEYLPYDDDVYCVEVPTHMIVVRSEGYSFIAGNCHHIGSETRLELIQMVKAKYILGLSATIPKGVKMFFRWKYKAVVISCDLTEAIEDEILPEPTILLMPLSLETTRQSEEIIINPKIKSPVITGEYKDRWKYKKQKNIKAILKCTQQQKLEYLNSQITWMKDQYMRTRSKIREQSWLYLCGKRLEFLADCKLNMVKAILSKLKDYRTITFCKTISQTEELGANCIHSKNKKAAELYNAFNNKKIKHITAVNILNENANLVDCKYAIFDNIPASEVQQVQRIGRSLRHKNPIIIIPYYKGTREQEIVDKLIAGFKPEFIKTIKSITEI